MNVVAAVVCADECCRGTVRTAAVEAALSRHRSARLSRSAVQVIPTDFDLARRFGSLLHGAHAPAADMVDAHCVAIATAYGGGIVVTADPGDIERLASAVPAIRVVTRPAR